MSPIDRRFYARDATLVARALIGTQLIRRFDDGRVAVTRIVETEAYRGPNDAACHARFGKTSSKTSLFGPPGRAYVFLVYGMHECFNLTCFGEGKGHAVLVRGVEPVSGLDEAVRTDGPGRLTRVLAITRSSFDGADMCREGALYVAPRVTRPARIATSARVGVAYAGEIAEAPWRFFDPTSRFVSRPSPKMIGLGGRSRQA